jgi:hypothetical protein
VSEKDTGIAVLANAYEQVLGKPPKVGPGFFWETPTISLKKGKNASILAPEMRISASTEPMNITG